MFPCVKVHGCQYLERGAWYEQIHALALTHVRSTIDRLIDDGLLFDLPRRFVQELDIGGDLGDVLDRTVMTHDLVFHFIVPYAVLEQILDQVFVDDDKFTGDGSS